MPARSSRSGGVISELLLVVGWLFSWEAAAAAVRSRGDGCPERERRISWSILRGGGARGVCLEISNELDVGDCTVK